MPQLPPGCKYRVRNATHICFELPDMQHVVDIRMYTNVVHMSVIHDVSNKYVDALFMTVDKKLCPQWEDIVEAYQEKAIKHFPKPIRHKSVTVERIRRGF